MQATTTEHPEQRAHHTELERLLTKLCIAITSGDGHSAARLWDVPAFVIGEGMTKAIGSGEEVASFFGDARAEYHKRGIIETRPEIVEEDWVGDNLVRVRVRWPYLDANRHEIGAESSDYIIARDDHGKLKLRVALMRGVEGQ
jgi:hypothetical protein